jgi:CheY-like chemotaxis protein
MASVVRTLKKVLVVDDNPAIRSEIHQEFNRHRSIAQMPKTAERVLEILPDLIILDLSMPVMKGLDAAPE